MRGREGNIACGMVLNLQEPLAAWLKAALYKMAIIGLK